MKRVIVESGLRGWQDRLQSIYLSLEAFQRYDDLYGLAERLGFPNAEEAWKCNPEIQGSVNPDDYRVVSQ